jgi:hypothetical protein
MATGEEGGLEVADQRRTSVPRGTYGASAPVEESEVFHVERDGSGGRADDRCSELPGGSTLEGLSCDRPGAGRVPRGASAEQAEQPARRCRTAICPPARTIAAEWTGARWLASVGAAWRFQVEWLSCDRPDAGRVFHVERRGEQPGPQAWEMMLTSRSVRGPARSRGPVPDRRAVA